ncbi:MAG: hypothetical protein ACKVJU_14480 [Verrucomicrobiales bacterium]
MKMLTLACLLLFPTFVQAVDFEKKVPLFAFGGVGFAGTTSQGEARFKEILKGPDSLNEFEKWFESGSDEARMYCLVAFYSLHRDQFDAALKSDKWIGKKVSAAQGCIVFQTPRSTIVETIKKGDYAIYVPAEKWENPPEKK